MKKVVFGVVIVVVIYVCLGCGEENPITDMEGTKGKYNFSIDNISGWQINKVDCRVIFSVSIENLSQTSLPLSEEMIWIEDSDNQAIYHKFYALSFVAPAEILPGGKVNCIISYIMGEDDTFGEFVSGNYDYEYHTGYKRSKKPYKLVGLFNGTRVVVELPTLEEIKSRLTSNPFNSGVIISNPIQEPEPGFAAYIVNSMDDTLSVFDIETHKIANDVMMLGKWPADIKIWDDKAYVVSTGDNKIQIIDLESLVEVGVILTGNKTGPRRIAFMSSKKAYVSCNFIDLIKAIDLTAGQVTKSIKVGKGPLGVAVARQKVYVCNTAYDFATNSYDRGTVSVIDSSSDKVIKTIDVETNPTEVVASDREILVLCTGDYAGITGELCIIDPDFDAVVKTIDLDTTPSSIAISPNNTAYVTSQEGLIFVDIDSGSVRHTKLAPGGSGLAIDRDGNIYVCIADWTVGANDRLVVIDEFENLIGSYRLGRGASIIALKE